MRIFSFVTQKDDSDKTNLAVNCAVAAVARKKRVIFDTDEQGTTKSWYQDREAEAPLLVRVKPPELEKALDAAKAKNLMWC